MHVSVKIKHRSSTDSNEKRMVYSKSDLSLIRNGNERD